MPDLIGHLDIFPIPRRLLHQRRTTPGRAPPIQETSQIRGYACVRVYILTNIQIKIDYSTPQHTNPPFLVIIVLFLPHFKMPTACMFIQIVDPENNYPWRMPGIKDLFIDLERWTNLLGKGYGNRRTGQSTCPRFLDGEESATSFCRRIHGRALINHTGSTRSTIQGYTDNGS